MTSTFELTAITQAMQDANTEVNGVVLTKGDAKQKTSKKASAKELLKAEKQKKGFEEMSAYLYLKQVGDALAEKDKTYHEHYVKNSNTELYKLLEEVMAFAEEVLAQENLKKIISVMRHNMKHSLQINTQANTPYVSVVVRYVIRTSRKNACVYARVIEKAFADGVTSKGLVQYINDNQGIDNIRKAAVKANAEKKSTQKKEVDIEKVKENTKFLTRLGECYLNHRVATGLSNFKIDSKHSGHLTDTTRYGEYKYFACSYVNGEYVVIDSIPMDGELETKLLERIASHVLAQQVFSKDEADALKEAAKDCNTTLKKEPYITNIR